MKALTIILLSLISCLGEVELLSCEVIREIPRKHHGFTQGLFILDGKLYESCGLYGQSLIRRIDLAGQSLELSKSLPDHIFAEGLTPIGDQQMVQITWQEKTAIVYDREHINVQKVFKYETEGWGIAHSGDQLVMSDGSSTLTFRSPQTFQPLKRVQVTLNGSPVKKLNELEWVNGYIYANVWHEDYIVKIQPESGKVVAIIDCSQLLRKPLSDSEAVLNGIAYDASSNTFYLTGKLWPSLFQVRFSAAR